MDGETCRSRRSFENILGCDFYKDVAPDGADYALNCFTASTQRPQSVGCPAVSPTSVSQCQQRSHFWPSARTTSTGTTLSPFVSISSCETLLNSRRYSRCVFASTRSEAEPRRMTRASTYLPMVFTCRAFS